jgi:deferrochelatase/peroxidase EfeB
MSLRRRELLIGGAAAGAGAAIGRIPGVAPATPASAASRVEGDLSERVPFEGAHQAGVLTARPRHAIFASFDAIAASPAELGDGLRALSQRARLLSGGYDALLGSPGEGPTPDSGVLGPQISPDALTVTIGFGASLFDRRYGLASRRPSGLRPMPAFPDDDLDAAECHGDVIVQLCANTEETLLHALRDISRSTRGVLGRAGRSRGSCPIPPARAAPGATCSASRTDPRIPTSTTRGRWRS